MDEPFYSPTWKPAPAKPRAPGEEIWMLRILRESELVIARRFITLAQAQAEILRRLLLAIRDFNTESGHAAQTMIRQADTMIRLTWAIAGLTILIALLTGLMLWKGLA